MSQNTDNLALTKLTTGENFSNSVLNANWDKVDAFAGTVNPERKPAISAIDSDSYLLGLNYGAYQVNLTSTAGLAYIPEQWGTLQVCKSGVTYRSFIFIGTSGKMYVRHGGTSSWHSAWQQLALNSQIAYTTGNPTKVTDSIWSTGSINLYKWGRVCMLKMNACAFSQNASRVAFATVPSAFVPIAEVSFRSDNSDGLPVFFIAGNGELRVNAQSGSSYYANAIYISAN